MTAKTRRPVVAAAPAQTVRAEQARIWARDEDDPSASICTDAAAAPALGVIFVNAQDHNRRNAIPMSDLTVGNPYFRKLGRIGLASTRVQTRLRLCATEFGRHQAAGSRVAQQLAKISFDEGERIVRGRPLAQGRHTWRRGPAPCHRVRSENGWCAVAKGRWCTACASRAPGRSIEALEPRRGAQQPAGGGIEPHMITQEQFCFGVRGMGGRHRQGWSSIGHTLVPLRGRPPSCLWRRDSKQRWYFDVATPSGGVEMPWDKNHAKRMSFY